MAPKWCKICKSYHEPRSTYICYTKKDGAGTGKFRYPRVGALLAAPIYGILATLPIAWLTDGAPASLIVFALVTPFAAWRSWPKKESRPAPSQDAEDSNAEESSSQPSPSAEKRSSGRPWLSTLGRWTRRALYALAALLLLAFSGLILHDPDILRYPSAYESYTSRYFDRVTDPFGHHEEKTTAWLVEARWQASVAEEVLEEGKWRELRRSSLAGKGAVDLSKMLPAEHPKKEGDEKISKRRLRVLHGGASLEFASEAFGGTTRVESLTLRRESDGLWRYLSFRRSPSCSLRRSHTKVLLEALRKRRKAYVQQRPYASVTVFVDDATFAKLRP